LFREQPSEDYYWRAVRGEVTFFEGGRQWGGNGRIGAAASCAWRCGNVTWEGIAWRKGSRKVSENALTTVEMMDGTFLCRDPRTNRGLIAPRGPCPVMFGVRATDRDTASKATQILIEGSSETIGSRIFATNQATGDHIEKAQKLVVKTKEMLQGGHIILNKNCLAFNESGDVNKIAQWLEIGDEIEFMGLEHEGNFHLEAIKVIFSSTAKRPLCECGTRMKSMGKGQGVRCPKCKRRSDQTWYNEERKPPLQGWVQPPADKRRHLAKTLT